MSSEVANLFGRKNRCKRICQYVCLLQTLNQIIWGLAEQNGLKFASTYLVIMVFKVIAVMAIMVNPGDAQNIVHFLKCSCVQCVLNLKKYLFSYENKRF